ncbi:hypothetical protein K503DRAFT_354023 [Rhizopogon vinicolor AM-OR11-026]|uniref:Uncharacterized protein n=1 Tax=Rhizopogon vinicolor AM-OR11-026 TaxID=1314800 RepID=A0A1B7NCA2_9AGAM|nr:hypothetical protein K503DRAFT_354023 [Rhizopogon vinicolor AM-OR11-026]
MSSGGTQSPPLEATGSHKPMGVSCIDGSVSEPMLDAEQRKTYFAEPELVSLITRSSEEAGGSQSTSSAEGAYRSQGDRERAAKEICEGKTRLVVTRTCDEFMNGI